MARKIQTRIQVQGLLVAASPIHVGGLNSSLEVDLALAVNGQGQFYIPGTSLAGALRSWMQTYGTESELNELWGFQLPKGSNSNKDGHASFILIEDAVIQGQVIAEIRDGVGIDRLYGSAAEGMKYDRAILPKGCQIEFNLSLDLQDSDNLYRNWLANLLNSLEQGEVRLGAAKTRGLGQIKLQNKSVVEYGFGDAISILRTLKGQKQSVSLFTSPIAQRPQLTIQIDWQPIGPLMVKAEGAGIAVDMLPLTSAVGNHLSFVLPGSSIKGSLRSQAERIMRTLLSCKIPDDADPKIRFLKQLAEIPLIISEIFGQAAQKQSNGAQSNGATNSHPKLGLGALSVDNCYADLPICRNTWEVVTNAQDQENLNKALQQISGNGNLRNIQHGFHVAIDRWTGGAADGFFYNTLEPMGITWQPIRLTLDLLRLKPEDIAVGIALILLLLRDLSQERISLGYATNRGMGAVQVNQIKLHGCDFSDDLQSLNQEIILSKGDISQLNSELLSHLNQAWTTWLNTQSEEKAQ